LADLQRTVYPHKWSPISCRSSAGQAKFAGQKPMFYQLCHATNQTQFQQSVHQYINTTTDADQNSTSVALISQLQKTVEDLSSVVQSQQRAIAALSCKLNFVLSFLDIQEGTTVLNVPTTDPHLTAMLRSSQMHALLEIVSQ